MRDEGHRPGRRRDRVGDEKSTSVETSQNPRTSAVACGHLCTIPYLAPTAAGRGDFGCRAELYPSPLVKPRWGITGSSPQQATGRWGREGRREWVAAPVSHRLTALLDR